MAKALAALYVSGASMVVLTLILPHEAEPEELGSFIVLGNAYLISALLYVFANRVPAWASAVVLAIGTVHISGVSYFSNGGRVR